MGNERQFHFQQGPNGDFHQANTVPDSHPIVDNETQQKSEGSPSDNGTSEPITNSSPVATDPHRYSLANQFRATFLYSWLNLLLVFLLIGIAVNNANVPLITVFTINLIAIIPLAGILGYASEEIAIRVCETLSGPVHTSFR